MIQKILIANRGEIALRIVRACREMGIKTLAVYSEADVQSLHVQLADEAICIGGPRSSDSYLRADRIISAAEIADVDAIHPGYGFLSENAKFAEQCESCNIKFIGPKSKSIKMMGDKAVAKETVRKAHVITVPGSDGPVEAEAEAVKVARSIGYPVIIKAVAGGGGRGMRIAHNDVSFAKEFHVARNEAEKAFGDGRVYIEKYIERPRHIEFQILADSHGKTIHLGERDCSVQRRHQKLIEESPSPFLTPDLRKKMGKAAVRAAEAAEYERRRHDRVPRRCQGQFLLHRDEHPDPGRASGHRGGDGHRPDQAADPHRQRREARIRPGRHQVREARDRVPDQRRGSGPQLRPVARARSASTTRPAGTGVRVDSHVYSGYVIPPYYDSMIGKLICFGSTRKEALERAYRALSEYLVRGIKTTIPLHKAIMADPLFIEGKATTAYMEDFLSRTTPELFS